MLQELFGRGALIRPLAHRRIRRNRRKETKWMERFGRSQKNAWRGRHPVKLKKKTAGPSGETMEAPEKHRNLQRKKRIH